MCRTIITATTTWVAFVGLLTVWNSSTAAEPDSASIQVSKDDWPWWRGVNRDSISSASQVPLKWDEKSNVVWKAAVPGRGHSSPTVVGSRVFLTTADEKQQVQSVLCFDQATGKQLWKTDLHRGGFEKEIHLKCSHAAPTVACDGERVFAAFLNNKQILVTALNLQGRQLWQVKVSDFNSKFGFGASPTIYKSTLIVATDNQGGGNLTALNRTSGSVVWQTPRQAAPTYSSPAIGRVAGKDQLLIAGADRIMSYDPNTGKLNWECKGATVQTVNTMAFAGNLAFASGGYPIKETLCILGDGSGKVVWHTKGQISNVPSMLVHDGHVYLATDDGIAICRNAQTGAIRWRSRLGGTFSASPVLAAGHIFVPNESGTVFVFKANPAKFESVAKNQLGDEMFATPTICGGNIFLRTADSSSGTRVETLYCIGVDKP